MGVCSSRSGGVLVIMVDDDSTETKLFRYHGLSKEKSFSIPGLDCYSHGCMKPCSENRNRDICVVDYAANAVVVVNQAGDLRFTYTGPPSTAKESFRPLDITTDSQSQILTVDCSLQRIHILDQDGQFLGYIDKCDLRGPCSLCVDTNDNLFVAESDTGKVKKIEHHFKSTNWPLWGVYIHCKFVILRWDAQFEKVLYHVPVYNVYISWITYWLKLADTYNDWRRC